MNFVEKITSFLMVLFIFRLNDILEPFSVVKVSIEGLQTWIDWIELKSNRVNFQFESASVNRRVKRKSIKFIGWLGNVSGVAMATPSFHSFPALSLLLLQFALILDEMERATKET